MSFEPWTAAPDVDGVKFRYLVRAGDASGSGEWGSPWPASVGYIECPHWAPDGNRAWHFRISDLEPSAVGPERGLYGFLDGRLGAWLLKRGTRLGATWQMLIVDSREVEQGMMFYEHRAPRGWLAFNGGVGGLRGALLAAGSDYGADVLQNFQRSTVEAVAWARTI